MSWPEYRTTITLLTFVYVLIVQACATVTEGRSQTVALMTDPAGARCTLTREGAILAVIQPTPGSIPIDRSSKNVSVNCELAEYKDATGVFEPKFADTSRANVLFGSLTIVGGLIDFGSGAMHEYDSLVTLTMIPAQFDSVADRDLFFDELKADAISASDQSMRLVSAKCKPKVCKYQKKEAELIKESRLAEIEKEREIAKIAKTNSSMTNKKTTTVAP